MTASSRQVEYLRAMGIDVWLWHDRAAERGPDERPPEAWSDDASVTDDAAEVAAAATKRKPREAASGLVIGPGAGSLLLVCDGPAEAALPVAADIARCLADEPVWGWPAGDGTASGVPLEDAIRERMFTGVMAFGESACAEVGEGVRGSASILRASSLSELAADPGARRELWSRLRATDWCVRPGRRREGR